MTRVQLTRGVMPQIHKQTNELELWTTATAGQTITPRVDFPAQYAGRVYWQISDGALKPATSGAEISHTFAANGPHRARLIGVPVDQITRIDADSDYITGDISIFPIHKYRSLATLSLYSTSVSGDISGWTLPNSLTAISLYSTSVSGDISGWTLPNSLADLTLSATSVSGDISGWILPNSLEILSLRSTSVSGDISGWILPNSLETLYLYSTSVTVASTFAGVGTGIRDFRIQDCGLIQAHVDNVVESIWDARARFTYATPNLNVGGSNAAPAGNVAAPPGDGISNSDWDWDGAKYIPLTAGAMIWDLAKDVNSEDFNKWAITYNGGSI